MSKTQALLLDRCCNYIQELLEIYESSRVNAYKHIETDLHQLSKITSILGQSATSTDQRRTPPQAGRIRWVDDVVRALEELGGRASLKAIYRKVVQIRTTAGRSVPENSDSAIRDCLETHSSDSRIYKPTYPDLFTMAKGRGSGIWALRNRKV